MNTIAPRFPEHAAPLANTTHITPDMARIVVPELMIRITEKSIRENTAGVGIYLTYKNETEGTDFKPVASYSERELAEKLVMGGHMDHVAIRGIKEEKDTESPFIALNGLAPFRQRMEAIGMIQRSPEQDVYQFPNGVCGIHLELHPDLIAQCNLNRNGRPHAPDFAKIFMSEIYKSDIPESYRNELINILKSGKDTMTAQELALLNRLRAGENLSDNELDVINDGLFRFMTQDFAPIPKALGDAMTEELAKHPETSKEYKKAEYPPSRVRSTTNHAAYNTKNLPAIFERMETARFDLIPVQYMSFLQQYGVKTSSIDKQWLELIERLPLKDEQGNNINYNGERCTEEYVARAFRPKNAYALFSAGNEAQKRG